MLLSTSRKLAKATTLSWQRQQALWDLGDHLIQCDVARQPDLAPGIEERLVEFGSDAMWAAWARTRRDPAVVERVAEKATSEFALLAIATQPVLTPRTLELLSRNPTCMLAATLLGRSDLPDVDRATLVHAHVSLQSAAKGYIPRNLAETIGLNPLSWVEAIRAALPNNSGIIAWPGLPDNPLVQEALLDVLEHPESRLLEAKTLKDVTTGMMVLLASPTLTLEQVARVRAAALPRFPDVYAAALRRADVNVPALMQQATCLPAGPSRNHDAVHIADMETLLGLIPTVKIPTLAGAYEALAHRASLPAGIVAAALGLARGAVARELLATIESVGGSSDPAIPEALKHVGLWPLNELQDPIPAIRSLAETGFEALLLPSNIPERAMATVAVHYAPAARVLSDARYTTIVLQHVDQVPAPQAETIWALVDEWEGNLVSLIAAANDLAEPNQRG